MYDNKTTKTGDKINIEIATLSHGKVSLILCGAPLEGIERQDLENTLAVAGHSAEEIADALANEDWIRSLHGKIIDYCNWTQDWDGLIQAVGNSPSTWITDFCTANGIDIP